jgi:ELWxxDGT repeat protein
MMKRLACALALLAFLMMTHVTLTAESKTFGPRPLTSKRGAGQVVASASVLLPVVTPASSTQVPQLIKDIFPGTGSSIAVQSSPLPVQAPVEAGGLLYFMANDGVSGRELWRTDGTAAGTFRVKDIFPGPNGSTDASSSNVVNLVNSGGVLFFRADDGGMRFGRATAQQRARSA